MKFLIMVRSFMNKRKYILSLKVKKSEELVIMRDKTRDAYLKLDRQGLDTHYVKGVLDGLNYSLGEHEL